VPVDVICILIKYKHTIQKMGVSNLKKLILLFSKDTLNGTKVTIKTFIMLQKNYNSNKCGYTLF